MNDDTSISSSGTIPLEDDSFFNFYPSNDNLNSSLYQFDNNNELGQDAKTLRDAFKNFEKKEIHEFSGLSLSPFLNKWSTD